jgi:inositol oxygenase
MRLYQTVDFVDKMETVLYKFDHARMTIREAADHLSKYVDRSDPDITLPNIEHLLQTAERARAAGKPDWFQLTVRSQWTRGVTGSSTNCLRPPHQQCLIHDLGKVVFLWGTPEDGMACASDGPQWAVGGDTFVVGCRIPDSTVYPEFNELNPDMKDPRYTSENGVYSPGCGIMNLRFAAGHDEYMYRFLLQNNPPLAAFPEALAIIRLHSCYPWHKGGAYRQFHKSDGSDDALLEAVSWWHWQALPALARAAATGSDSHGHGGPGPAPGDRRSSLALAGYPASAASAGSSAQHDHCSLWTLSSVWAWDENHEYVTRFSSPLCCTAGSRL